MPETVSDSEIAQLIAERKVLPGNWQDELENSTNKDSHAEGQVNLVGESGTQFRVIIRQSLRSDDDFSVILMVSRRVGEPEIRLLRFDGGSHPHRNKVERNWIVRKPHIHRATERYQELKWEFHDGYAEETSRYHDLSGAWESFVADANLQSPTGDRISALPKLFTEG